MDLGLYPLPLGVRDRGMGEMGQSREVLECPIKGFTDHEVKGLSLDLGILNLTSLSKSILRARAYI